MSIRIVPMQRNFTPGAPARRRSGFSLIEVLIAIGVIVVLMGIGVYGYLSLQDSTSRKQAYTILATGESLLKEMASTGAFNRIEGPTDQSPAPVFQTGATTGPYTAIVIDKPERDTLIAQMQKVMKVLLAVPANKKAVEGMPRESIVPPKTPPTPPVPYPYPMLADPWENPILLVPSGGLKGVTTQGGSNLTVVSPGKRPFWASAGPDGDFSKGDDNLYSFDK